MQRFFVEPYQVQEEEHRITLTGPDVNHMKNVLRMRIGEDVWISDGGQKEYHCTIEAFEEEGAVLHILYAQEPQYERSVPTTWAAPSFSATIPRIPLPVPTSSIWVSFVTNFFS